MQLNYFPVQFEFDNFHIRKTTYSDERLIELRNSFNNTHSFFRNGNDIYISNFSSEDELDIQCQVVTKNVYNDQQITSSLLKHIFFRTFKERFVSYTPVDEGIRDVIVQVLADAGLIVISSNHKGYMDHIAAHHPDVIILDYFMTEANGAEICKLLKNNPGTNNIPVILSSGVTGLESLANDCNADDILPKPFDIEDLRAIVIKWLMIRIN